MNVSFVYLNSDGLHIVIVISMCDKGIKLFIVKTSPFLTMVHNISYEQIHVVYIFERYLKQYYSFHLLSLKLIPVI